MSYATGVPISEKDLLQKLVIFLAALGWHSNGSAAEGLGWRVHLDKGGIFVSMRGMTGDFISGSDLWPGALVGGGVPWNGIGITVGTGFTGVNAWYDQPGVMTYTSGGTPYPFGLMGANTMNPALPLPFNMAPFTRYHFFADANDNVAVVLERSPLNFCCFGWGPSLTKTGGVWTGGAYMFGSSGPLAGAGQQLYTQGCPFSTFGWNPTDANAAVKANVDSYTGKWLGHASDAQEAAYGKVCTSGVNESTDPPRDVPWIDALIKRSFSAMNAQANLIPIDIYAHRDGGGYSLLGTLPSIFATNAATYGNLSSGSVYSIGADNYMVFAGRASAPAIPGFAIKKT